MTEAENEMIQFWLNLLKVSNESSVKMATPEDDGRPLCDYLLPKEEKIRDLLKTQPRGNLVKFLNLRSYYEKIQTRRDGISAQRPMDCNIRMVAVFGPAWTSRNIEVFVQRHPESARLCGDLNGKVKLEVIAGNKQDNKEYFSVDLDSVYKSRFDTPVYKLSTVDPLRRNKFVLIVRLSSQERKEEQFFTSRTFQIRSRRPSKTTTKTIHFKSAKEFGLAVRNKRSKSS